MSYQKIFLLCLSLTAPAAFAQNATQIAWGSTNGSSTPGQQAVFSGNITDGDGASDINVVEIISATAWFTMKAAASTWLTTPRRLSGDL